MRCIAGCASLGLHSRVHTTTSHPTTMPICIECRYPVSTLYTTYSKADDKALGKGVRLTQCPRCKRFADKYVEHDFVVLFIDLVLIKPQVRTERRSVQLSGAISPVSSAFLHQSANISARYIVIFSSIG